MDRPAGDWAGSCWDVTPNERYSIPVRLPRVTELSAREPGARSPGWTCSRGGGSSPLEFVGDDGTRTSVFGRLDRRPDADSRDSSDLRLGLPLIVTRAAVPASGPSRIYMVRRVDHRKEVRGTLVGEISPEYLWGTLDQSMPSATTLVSVVDDSGRVLFSSATHRPSSLRENLHPAARADGRHAAETPCLSSTRPAPGLTRSSPRRPGRSCSASPGRGARSRWCPSPRPSSWSCVLSSTDRPAPQRDPDPAEPAAARGAAGRAPADRAARFRQPGRHPSRDEFEELGTSFNAMADQLDRQFQALATAAEIDRAVLSATDASSIVATLLARMRDVYPCSSGERDAGGPDGAKSLPSLVHDYGDGARRQVAGWTPIGRTCRSCSTGPEVLESAHPDESVPVPLPRAAGRARGARPSCPSALASSASWSASSPSATAGDARPHRGRPGAGAPARRSGRGGAGQRANAGAGARPWPTTTV